MSPRRQGRVRPERDLSVAGETLTPSDLSRRMRCMQRMLEGAWQEMPPVEFQSVAASVIRTACTMACPHGSPEHDDTLSDAPWLTKVALESREREQADGKLPVDPEPRRADL